MKKGGPLIERIFNEIFYSYYFYSTVLSGDCDERMSYLSSSEAYDL